MKQLGAASHEGTTHKTSGPSGQKLIRQLSLHSVVAFGLAYLAPIIVLGIFGVISEKSNGGTSGAYLIASVAMFLTAIAYARLARATPTAGSAYTYVRKEVSHNLGFLVGWASMLDYVVIPMVIWLIGASFLHAQFPAVPNWVWIIAFIIVTTTLNILGITVADKVNLMLLSFEVLVIALFVVFSIIHLVKGGHSLAGGTPFTGSPFQISALAAGAATAAYSFLGFDAVTTLSEETIHPRRTIPRAILLTAVIGGAIFVVSTYFIELVRPFVPVRDPDSAALDIARQIGGIALSAIFLAGLIVGQFASGIAAQASASRLMYAMGRDGVLPRRVFGVLRTTRKTPVNAILTVALVGIIGCFLDVSTSTSFINFGAFIAFAMVNVSSFAMSRRRKARGAHPHWFTGWVAPVLGAIVILYLLTQLDRAALIVGGTWLALGVVMLAWLTRGFRLEPPRMDE